MISNEHLEALGPSEAERTELLLFWKRDREPAGRLYIECARCGFEPVEQESLPRGACPKCHSSSWQRLVRPRPPRIIAHTPAPAARSGPVVFRIPRFSRCD